MDLRVSKSVRRIVVIRPGQDGKWQTETLYQKKQRKKKKGTRRLRPLEKKVLTRAKANRKAFETYEKRHKKSNRKRRDGWLRDLNYNLYRTAAKKVNILKRPPIVSSPLACAVAGRVISRFRPQLVRSPFRRATAQKAKILRNIINLV